MNQTIYKDIVYISYELWKQRLDWFISTRDDLWRSPMWIHVHRSLNPISRLPDKWLEWGQRPASNTGPAAPYKYRYRRHTNTNKSTIQIQASNSQIDHFAGAIDWPRVIWRGGRQIVSQCPAGPQTWLHFEPHTSIYIYILILIVLPLRKCFFSSYSELWVIVSRNTYNSSWYFDRFWSFDISHLIRHFSQHPTFMLYPNHLIPPPAVDSGSVLNLWWACLASGAWPIKMAPVIRGRRYLEDNEEVINTNTIQSWHKYKHEQKHKYKCLRNTTTVNTNTSWMKYKYSRNSERTKRGDQGWCCCNNDDGAV